MEKTNRAWRDGKRGADGKSLAVPSNTQAAGFARRLRIFTNQWLQLVSYQKKHLHSWAKPDLFQIEPTNHCNLKCPMCPHDLMTREVGFMDLELFRLAVDQVAGHSASVRLHNMGESLFHKRIDEFISYARQRGLRTVLSTNASALTQRAGERILDAGLEELLISFDGTTKDTYEFFREGARYEKVLEKIEAFLALKERRKARRPQVTMSLINMPMTHGEIRTFQGRWRGRVDSIRIKPPRNWDGSSERINRLVGLGNTRPGQAPCSWLWQSLVILWDGRVVPCCMDYDAKAVLGNIKEKTLEAIFNDAPMEELRRLHVQGRVSESELCRGCSAPTGLEVPFATLVAGVGHAWISTLRLLRAKS